MEDVIRIKDLLKAEDESDVVFEEEEIVTHDERLHIPINHIEVAQAVIEEVEDTHGRLSDIVDNMISITGCSVIPFEMCGISNSVIKLARHDIFVLGDTKYAMSVTPRLAVVEDFKNRITNTLKSGVAFKESLNRSITYDSKLYTTLALSSKEWDYVLSYFKKYRQDVYATLLGDIILEVGTEVL